MPVDTNDRSNLDSAGYSNSADASHPQQSWEAESTVSPEVAALIQSQANLMNRVKILTGLLIGAVLLSMGSLVWSGRQSETQIIAEQSAIEAAADGTVDPTAATTDPAAIADPNPDLKEPVKVTRKLAELEQQIQDLAQETPENVAAQVSETQAQLATVTANLNQAEAEIADLRNLTSALQQVVDRQLAAPVPEAAQPVPSSIPEPATVPDSL